MAGRGEAGRGGAGRSGAERGGLKLFGSEQDRHLAASQVPLSSVCSRSPAAQLSHGKVGAELGAQRAAGSASEFVFGERAVIGGSRARAVEQPVRSSWSQNYEY